MFDHCERDEKKGKELSLTADANSRVMSTTYLTISFNVRLCCFWILKLCSRFPLDRYMVYATAVICSATQEELLLRLLLLFFFSLTFATTRVYRNVHLFLFHGLLNQWNKLANHDNVKVIFKVLNDFLFVEVEDDQFMFLSLMLSHVVRYKQKLH
ncbi:CLUMA_CG018319, isoform A [Clunio marinus]|uniref:CLUMA_CG018319, isoform A n=1 Tax=Clunio marinus TaxID=568069 RepID=A0A1J1IYR2_9DIPT|nr:CLUMA_CG018319, isoform A [Clunio marinus]